MKTADLQPESTPPTPRAPRPWRRFIVHAGRILLVAAILILVRLEQNRFLARESALADWSVTLEDVQHALPNAASFGQPNERTLACPILDADGEVLGHAVQTAPDSNGIIGFSGPSNMLLVFDSGGVLQDARVLSSGDTRDHVERVNTDAKFLRSFRGKTWNDLANSTHVDGVSGATLTSMAMYNGIVRRLGGSQLNVFFPDDPPSRWVARVYPGANALTPTEFDGEYIVRDKSGAQLGVVLRTSPLADGVMGYQGPTETLICLGNDNPGEELKVRRVVIGRSFDNEEYVSYLREDPNFPEAFNGLILEEIAEGEARIDGVSGATFTSNAVVKAIVQVASVRTKPEGDESALGQLASINWGIHDIGILVVLLVTLVVGHTHLRGWHGLRLSVQLLVIVYLGLINGSLISQAMLFGWARSGVPWLSAMGLVAITAVAFAVPTVSKKNLYCTHICPHGAVQQLMSTYSKWRYRLGAKWRQILSFLPGLLLLWCVLTVVAQLPFSTVDIEPFDAWLFRVAGWPTIAVAVVSLIASLFVPMAYCQYGCPTGALLRYLRRHARSDEFTWGDLLGLTALCLAVGFYLWG
ncbi:MAG: FMN-binding protein [Planctomycetaceae bacterium]|nr:FMN-binding protein [Planctomycetaceae bacterium]